MSRSFSRRQLVVGAAFAAFVVWTGLLNAQTEVSLPEIQASWKAYVEAIQPNHSVQVSRSQADDSQNATISRAEFWGTQDAKVYEAHLETSNGEPLRSFAEGENARYRFRLEKDKPSDEWLLKNVTRLTQEEAERIDASKWGGLLVIGDLGRADELLGRDDVDIRSIEQVGDAVIVKFVPAPAADHDSLGAFASVEMALDPQAMFIVQSAKVLYMPSSNTKEQFIENQYDIENGVPYKRRSNVRSIYSDWASRVSSEVESREFDLDIPASRFTLTHYGLPEPPEHKAPGSYRTQPWLYYFVGGVLCVAVGAFFVHRATRGRRAA